MSSRLQTLFEVPPSPLQRLRSPQLEAAQVECWVKRDDLLNLPVLDNAFAFSGNKWRKLKYNLFAAQKTGQQKLLTFGGAFSNHLAAVAAAGHYFGFETIGIVRGEEPAVLNHTLRFVGDCEMKVVFVSRSEYRQKATTAFNKKLEKRYGDFYMIPEGGTNVEALKGTAELATELLEQLEIVPDEIRLCCGTGGTAAGLIQGLAGESYVKAYSVLKGDFHQTAIQALLSETPTLHNWQIFTDAHCGGYAKTTPELRRFIQHFTIENEIFLDPIYTGKLFFAFWKDLQNNRVKAGTKVIIIHSGGLQGIAGFNERFATQLPAPTQNDFR